MKAIELVNCEIGTVSSRADPMTHELKIWPQYFEAPFEPGQIAR